MNIYDVSLVTPDDKTAAPTHGSTGSAKLNKESTSTVSVRFYEGVGWLDDYDWEKNKKGAAKKVKKPKGPLPAAA